MGRVFQQKLQSEQPLATKLLESAIEKKQLANAYLLVGDNIKAKFEIATQVAAYRNCTSVHIDSHGTCLTMSREPGDRCQNCEWISQRKHPQAWLELANMLADTVSSKIPVEAARLLSVEFTKTSKYKRVAIVENADQDVFHRPSANALLKTIEEPRADGVFFLFSRAKEMVLTTIVSRCQVVPVVLPGELMLGPVSTVSFKNSSYLSRLTKDLDADSVSLLDQLKEMSFYDWARTLKTAGLSKASKQHVRPSQAIELSKYLLTLSSKLEDSDLTLDSAFVVELEIIGSKTIDSSIIAEYLSQLLILTEEAKSRISRYVGKKAVFESYVFKWSQLRANLSG